MLIPSSCSINRSLTFVPELSEFKKLNLGSVKSNSAGKGRGPESVLISQKSPHQMQESAFGGNLRFDPTKHREKVVEQSNFPPCDLIDNYFQYVTSPFSIPEVGEEEISLLDPLRERDVKALAALFEGEEVEAIATDVSKTLSRLSPEPCWEDDPFDFIREYL